MFWLMRICLKHRGTQRLTEEMNYYYCFSLRQMSDYDYFFTNIIFYQFLFICYNYNPKTRG